MIKIASFNVENLYARPKAFGFTDMSIATRHLFFNCGKEPVNSFINDYHPEQLADFAIVNLTYIMKVW